MEPTGPREARPDDKLRAMRGTSRRGTNPDFAALHPGYKKTHADFAPASHGAPAAAARAARSFPVAAPSTSRVSGSSTTP